MTRAIVVGAGLAGLRCATDLVAAGLEVMVLEGRDRVGGRVLSHRFTNGQTAERGAEFIDGNHTEVLALARELGLSVTDRRVHADSRDALLDAAGRAVPVSLHASVEPDRERWARWLAIDRDGPELSLAQLMAAMEPPLSAMSKLAIGRELRTEFMLPPEEVGSRFAAANAAIQPATTRELHRVVGGNDQLAHGLAAALGHRVRLRAPVRSLGDDGRVTLLDGTTLTAEVVVAAVPLPVLSRLWPQMPAAIAAVGYGVGGKISVQFGRRIWRDYGRSGAVLTDRAWGQVWEASDDQPGDTGVLTNLLASHDGASFAALPEAPTQLVRELDRLFPGAAGLAGERVHTDWSNDPFSLGTYACFGAGQLEAVGDSLTTSYDHLFLAGEHTGASPDGFAGFMEGALRSGARTAAQILAAA